MLLHLSCMHTLLFVSCALSFYRVFVSHGQGPVSHVYAGYFAAPGARLYPLSHRRTRRPKPLPPVTLVFCALESYPDIIAENHVHGELATAQAYTACRQLLKARSGYECGTEEGTFLAAFSTVSDAIQFCIVVWHTGLDDHLSPCRIWPC